MSAVAARRTDLDWLRIAAFGTLILYHVGMFYVTWDWHVKSPHASHAIEPLMLLVNPWRLTLLFIISGVATRVHGRQDERGGAVRLTDAAALARAHPGDVRDRAAAKLLPSGGERWCGWGR